MAQNPPDLLAWKPPVTDRHGATYSREHDLERLNRQQRAVYDAMKAGDWLTLRELGSITGEPEASISARIRDFRKAEMSTLYITVESRRRGDAKRGIWEYRLVTAAPN